MDVMAAPARDITITSAALAAEVTAAELDEFLTQLRTLTPTDWSLPTECPNWTVRDVAAHVAGQCEGAAKLRVFLRRHRIGHRRYPEKSRLDAMTQQQVDDLGSLPPESLIEMLARVGPKAVRANRRVPGFVRNLNLSRMFPEDPLPDPRFGYILDVIAARDTWMHRVDIATATGRPVVLGTHDREIVAQVVRDLGLAWTGPAITLELTGPAGGIWTLGPGTPTTTARVDAVAYLRTLSGRDNNPPLEVTGDPTITQTLATARVVF